MPISLRRKPISKTRPHIRQYHSCLTSCNSALTYGETRTTQFCCRYHVDNYVSPPLVWSVALLVAIVRWTRFGRECRFLFRPIQRCWTVSGSLTFCLPASRCGVAKRCDIWFSMKLQDDTTGDSLASEVVGLCVLDVSVGRSCATCQRQCRCRMCY